VLVYPLDGSDTAFTYVLAWKTANSAAPANSIFRNTVSATLRIVEDF